MGWRRGGAPLAVILAALVLAAPLAAAYSAEARGVYRGFDPRPGLSTEGAWSWQDYPYWVPGVEPLAVRVVEGFLAEDFRGPVSFEFERPVGEFSRIILRVDVELVSVVEGRPAVQYDRPLWIWVNGVPAFVGTTTQRYSYTAFADVTHLYPLLVGPGEAVVSVALPNWVIPELGLTGAFKVDVTLLYYPGPKPSWAPDAVIPLFDESGASPWPGVAAARLTSDSPGASQAVELPEHAARAFLLVYVEGASYDEFWYASMPTPRLFVFKAAGEPVAIVPPMPWMYTGSLNPLLWRPVPGVRTLSFEPILVEVTHAIPLIAGGGELSVEALGIRDYWMLFAALLVYTDNRVVGHELVSLSYDIPEVRAEGSADDGASAYRFLYSASLTAEVLVLLRSETGALVEAPLAAHMEVSLQGFQESTGEDLSLEVAVAASYSSEASSLLPGPPVWSRTLTINTVIDYSFTVDPEGDPAEATPDNPVPATFELYASVEQSLRVRGLWPFTATYRESTESVDAESLIAGELIFIGPTAAIITGITEAWGVNEKTVTGEEYQSTPWGRPAAPLIDFYRRTVGSNQWPQWSIDEDTIIVAWL